MRITLIASDDGYGPDEESVFKDYVVIAHPLPEREDRVFKRSEDHCGTTYASHDYRLALHRSDVSETGRRRGRDFYVLEHHGAGRRVYRGILVFDGGAALRAIEVLPGRVLYPLLYGIAQTAAEAYRQGAAETAAEWRRAHLDGRIRKKRRNGSLYVEIEAEWEKQARLDKRQRTPHARGAA